MPSRLSPLCGTGCIFIQVEAGITMDHTSILFICLGNICCSPLAQGVFREEAQRRGVENQLTIDSAGTGGWHIGNPPDQRSIDIAAAYNIDISSQICRRLTASDFHDFDFILAMDKSNISNAKPANHQSGPAHLALFTEFGRTGHGSHDEFNNKTEIPDPYYGGPDGFEIAYQMIKQASNDTLDRIFG